MVPIVGDLGKVGKWTVKGIKEVAALSTVKIGKELVTEGGERLLKEEAEKLAEQQVKKSAKAGTKQGLGDATIPAAIATVKALEEAARRHPTQTCENDVLDKLQKKKDEICNSMPGKSCSPSKVSPKLLARRPCSQIRLRIKSVKACLQIRQEIQDTCFGGKPDPVHLTVMKGLNDGLAHCVALAAINCAPGHPMANL
jgi:hypothetical protein